MSIPIAPATTPAITYRLFHMPDPSDIDPLPNLTPPPTLTKSVARKSKSFQHPKSFDATISDEPTTSALQYKFDQQSTSLNTTDLKTVSDSCSVLSQTFFEFILYLFC